MEILAPTLKVYYEQMGIYKVCSCYLIQSSFKHSPSIKSIYITLCLVRNVKIQAPSFTLKYRALDCCKEPVLTKLPGELVNIKCESHGCDAFFLIK